MRSSQNQVENPERGSKINDGMGLINNMPKQCSLKAMFQSQNLEVKSPKYAYVNIWFWRNANGCVIWFCVHCLLSYLDPLLDDAC